MDRRAIIGMVVVELVIISVGILGLANCPGRPPEVEDPIRWDVTRQTGCIRRDGGLCVIDCQIVAPGLFSCVTPRKDGG